jgi:hypothetical protein
MMIFAEVTTLYGPDNVMRKDATAWLDLDDLLSTRSLRSTLSLFHRVYLAM